MNSTPKHWYNRPSIKDLVIHARREGTIKRRGFDNFKIAARGKETHWVWSPAEGDPEDHPLFKLLTDARNLEIRMLRALRNIPDDYLNRPEFYEKDGSRRAEYVWILERDQELPSVADAIGFILDQNPGVGEA